MPRGSRMASQSKLVGAEPGAIEVCAFVYSPVKAKHRKQGIQQILLRGLQQPDTACFLACGHIVHPWDVAEGRDQKSSAAECAES